MSFRHTGVKMGPTARRSKSLSFAEKPETQEENFYNLRSNKDLPDMAYRSEYIVRWLWYAFNTLDDTKVGSLSKTQIKMLTAHLGSARMARQTVQMATNPNDLLNDTLQNNTDTMTFDDYVHFLSEKGFLDPNKIDMGKLEEACWMLCNRMFKKRTPKLTSVTSAVLQRLWRFFNFFTEPDVLPPVIDREEAAVLTERLVVAMGTKYQPEKFEEASSKSLHEEITILDYLKFLETHILPDMDSMCVSEGVATVHRNLVEEVEKVGFMKKRGHKNTNWRERWFVLKLGTLEYFSSSDMRDKKGEVELNADWTVESVTDKAGKNTFRLYRKDQEEDTNLRYEMMAPDPLSRQEWITALNYIIKRSRGTDESDNWKELCRRREKRLQKRQLDLEAEKKRQEDEEDRERQRQAMEDLQKSNEENARRAQEEAEKRRAKELEEEQNRLKEQEHRAQTEKEIEQLKAANEEALRRAKEEADQRDQKEREENERRKLEEEEKERMMKEFAELQIALQDAKKRAAIEAALKEADRQRRFDLEESLVKLEGLLEEETQAKHDEEIVRGIQARLLEEETVKREELEKLKEEQDRMLEEEQGKRQHLEQVSEELKTERQEQQKLLEMERQKLHELEKERKSADEQLQEAMDKLLAAEQKKKDQERRRKELEKPVGLARLIQPKANPLKSHRGVGAFTESQFEVIKQLRKQWKDRRTPEISEASQDTSEASQEEPNQSEDMSIEADQSDRSQGQSVVDGNENCSKANNHRTESDREDDQEVNGDDKIRDEIDKTAVNNGEILTINNHEDELAEKRNSVESNKSSNNSCTDDGAIQVESDPLKPELV